MSARKWVLVTGGARRLGRAVALEAARRGWNIVIQYRGSHHEAAAAGREAQAFGAQTAFIPFELAAADGAALIHAAREAAHAPLNALVNAAAIFEHDTLDAISPAEFGRHMQINALAPAQMMAAFAAALPEDERGAIVNFLDYKLAAPYADHFSYTLSKFALAGASDMAARALAPRVRVNAIAPGYVLPSPGQSEEDFRRLHPQTPLGRGTTPQDVAAAAIFLLENEAITGQTLYLDSGLRFAPTDRDFMFR